MTAFFRPYLVFAAALAPLFAMPAAQALPVSKSASAEPSSNILKVGDRYDRRYHRRHYRDDRGRNVVHAPFTRVESGRRTIVDAPFAHVYSDRYGRTHVRAPFVDYWD